MATQPPPIPPGGPGGDDDSKRIKGAILGLLDEAKSKLSAAQISDLRKAVNDHFEAA